MELDNLIAAHRYSIRNRDWISRSWHCGCFHCLSLFLPVEIEEWTDSDATAICPRCQIDSVIGSASGYSLTRTWLEGMRDHWFGDPTPAPRRGEEE